MKIESFYLLISVADQDDKTTIMMMTDDEEATVEIVAVVITDVTAAVAVAVILMMTSQVGAVNVGVRLEVTVSVAAGVTANMDHLVGIDTEMIIAVTAVDEMSGVETVIEMVKNQS